MNMGTYQKESAISLVEDVEPEDPEADVEEVLKKQNKHDLLCPNCNSCISRRVILRKRRQRVPRFRPVIPILLQEDLLAPVASCAHLSSPLMVTEDRKSDFDILKSIVYGGLIESIASLVVI